ncbi:MAG: PAS domain S-box protein [Nitrospirae bacterium]|nr:PAS domain S-box protein [Nitrospirota bacterium]
MKNKIQPCSYLSKISESKEKYQSLINYAGDVILLADIDGNIIEINKKGVELFGYTQEEILNLNIRNIHPIEELDKIFASFKVIFESKANINVEDTLILTKDGTIVPVDINGSFIEFKDKSLVLGIFRDITHKKYQNRELLKQFSMLEAINQILNISLMPSSLIEQLQSILNIILTLPWLSIIKKGCIFLVENDEDFLTMKVSVGLSTELIDRCKKISFNECLCGAAAATKQIVFSKCIDDSHHIRFEKMQPHGHYCLPIINSKDKVFGVLNLYVSHGHIRDEREDVFLTTIMKTIARIVEHKYMELELQNSKLNLEIQVENRTLQLQKTNKQLSLEIEQHREAQEKLTHSNNIQKIIEAVLRISLFSIELTEIFNEILKILVTLPIFNLKSKAGIFIFNPDTQKLHLKSHINFNDDQLKGCSEIDLGVCLCGKAAQNQKMIFVDKVNNLHDIKYKDMCPHGHYIIPIMYNTALLGVLNLYVDQGHVAQKEEEEFLNSISSILAGVIKRNHAISEVEEKVVELRKIMSGIVETISKTVEVRDPYTSGHQRRVSDLARAIALKLNLTKDQIESVRTAALIHDIGKIAVPAEILSKPGKISNAEFSLIQMHCDTAYDILKTIDFPWPIAQIVHQHHEAIDGSGYPLGLKGDEILFEAKIISVADVVEAVSAHRPYRPSLGINIALDSIKQEKGKKFEPVIVDACIQLFEEDNFKF